MTTSEIIDAVNAYAEAQKVQGSDRAWLALVHSSNRSAAATAARTIRDAGRDALDEIQDWPTIEKRDAGACVLQAPDGSLILYYCERPNEQNRSFERLTQL
jgi:hypothetical protein